MKKVFRILGREFSRKAGSSILQLTLGGAVIYLIAVVAGPTYSCGAGNTQLMEGMLNCARGEMPLMHKIIIIGGIVLASLCWGRAASLYEKRRSAG